MKETLSIRHLTTDYSIKQFWRRKRQYEKEDIFPGNTREEIEDRAYFLSDDYYDQIMNLYRIPQGGGSGLKFVFFYLNDDYIGFSMYKIYTEEDGKAFILDYCIDKNVRNIGLGHKVWQSFETLLKTEGATYFALNTFGERRERFWKSIGFIQSDTKEELQPLYYKDADGVL